VQRIKQTETHAFVESRPCHDIAQAKNVARGLKGL